MSICDKKTIIDIVMLLVFDLEGDNYKIGFERFYSSMLFFGILKWHKIEFICMVMSYRLKFSEEMKNK